MRTIFGFPNTGANAYLANDVGGATILPEGSYTIFEGPAGYSVLIKLDQIETLPVEEEVN